MGVLTDSLIGRQDGVCRKRSGAAGFMARVAPVKLQVVVPLWEPPLRHTIAMPGSLIGWRGGVYPRKPGAARMLERVALQQQEDLLGLDLLADLTRVERWHSCAIFWCLGPVLYARCVICRGWHSTVLALAHAPSSGARAVMSSL